MAWDAWKSELLCFAETKEREVLLGKMCKEEQYKVHLANDHSPYLKGCPVCVQAQGRRRCHWRSGFPTVHSASFDIAGPFIPGQSFDPVASGRDQGGGYRYFLACSYAVPEKYRPEGPGDSREKSDEVLLEQKGVVEASEPELFPELFGEQGSELGLRAVTHRIKGKRPEGEPIEGGV